jgi:hypothetical protein
MLLPACSLCCVGESLANWKEKMVGHCDSLSLARYEQGSSSNLTSLHPSLSPAFSYMRQPVYVRNTCSDSSITHVKLHKMLSTTSPVVSRPSSIVHSSSTFRSEPPPHVPWVARVLPVPQQEHIPFCLLQDRSQAPDVVFSRQNCFDFAKRTVEVEI